MITSGCIWNLTRSHAFAAFARAEVCSASEPGYTHLDGTKRTKRTLDGIIGMQLIELIREMHEMHEMCGSSKTLRKENERDARRNLLSAGMTVGNAKANEIHRTRWKQVKESGKLEM